MSLSPSATSLGIKYNDLKSLTFLSARALRMNANDFGNTTCHHGHANVRSSLGEVSGDLNVRKTLNVVQKRFQR